MATRRGHNGNELLDLLGQAARGEAAREEVVAALRKRKVDALEVLVELAAASQGAERRTRAALRRFGPADVVPSQRRRKRAGPPHQEPRLPVALNGTVYDPKDIVRFNDTDLDFVAAGDQLLAFDDRTVLDNWLLTATLTSAASSNAKTLKAKPDTTTVHPTSVTNGGEVGYTGAVLVPIPQPDPHTNFYEDVGFDGSRFELAEDYACNDLTEASMGWFGNWNDQISSVQFVATQYALLGEHVNFDGSRLLLHYTQDTTNLLTFGWNDRASSVFTTLHTPPVTGYAWVPWAPYTPWHP